MYRILIACLFFSTIASAHPGVGIVKDSKGNIYYTDLEKVWKITNGKRTVLLPNVHTHELYVSAADELYGEGGYYDNSTKKFYHYLWVYKGNGRIDTVIGMKQAYVEQDFSLARDPAGNEYYIKRNVATPDTLHMFKRTPDGNENVFAKGNFGGIAWLHPQNNGTVLYVKNNILFKVDSTGKIAVIKQGIGKKPTFVHSRNAVTLFGAWRDKNEDYYVAVFSDQVVKKIDRNGNLTDIYRSEGNWTPIHGVFDNNDQLWVLETNDKNEVKASLVETKASAPKKKNRTSTFIIIIVVLFAAAAASRRRRTDTEDNQA